MIFILSQIVFASLFGLCIKWVGNREREDIITVGMINYIVAAIVSLPELANLPTDQIAVAGVATGATMGVAYFIAYFFCVYATKWIGVASSTVVSILSICVPIFFGVFIWHEDPNPFQWLGIILALLSLSLIGRKGDAVKQGTVPDKPWFTPWVVFGFFVLCGVSRLAQESFKHLCDESQRPVYLTSAFAIAAIPSIVVLFYRGKKVSWNELWMGVGLRLTNILQTHFILKALQRFDGFIVFPITSAGSLMFVTLVRPDSWAKSWDVQLTLELPSPAWRWCCSTGYRNHNGNIS